MRMVGHTQKAWQSLYGAKNGAIYINLIHVQVNYFISIRQLTYQTYIPPAHETKPNHACALYRTEKFYLKVQ